MSYIKRFVKILRNVKTVVESVTRTKTLIDIIMIKEEFETSAINNVIILPNQIRPIM